MSEQLTTERTERIEAAKAPTFDEIAESYVEDMTREERKRVNVFAECIKDGKVTVETADQASQIARMVIRADRELEEAKAIAAEIIHRAQARIDSLKFLFHTPMEIWTSVQLVGKKRRSVLLEGGLLSLRKVPESTRFEDAGQTLTWAQASLPAAVELVPKLTKLDLVLEWEKANKQPAPGRILTPEHDSFKISIPK